MFEKSLERLATPMWMCIFRFPRAVNIPFFFTCCAAVEAKLVKGRYVDNRQDSEGPLARCYSPPQISQSLVIHQTPNHGPLLKMGSFVTPQSHWSKECNSRAPWRYGIRKKSLPRAGSCILACLDADEFQFGRHVLIDSLVRQYYVRAKRSC